MAVPAALSSRIRAAHGEAGDAWLASLPGLLHSTASRWRVRLGDPMPDLTHAWLAPALADDGSAAMLKARMPGEEFRMEVRALRALAGDRCVKLLRVDEQHGLLLLERLDPAAPLAEIDDDEEATRHAADLMAELWRDPPEAGHLSTAEWTRGIEAHRRSFGGPGPLPADVFDAAERLQIDLLADSPRLRLLHGDLHHFNILLDQGRWKAVDPRGIIGEPAFEMGPFLDNPRPLPSIMLERRIAILGERLEIEPRRIAGWGTVYGVLSACWSIEDGESAQALERAIELSRRLLGLAP